MASSPQVRNSYDFDDKKIQFNISKLWSHARGVLSNVFPAMAAEADALRAKGSHKKRPEAAPSPATVLVAEVKRLQDNATFTAAEDQFCRTVDDRFDKHKIADRKTGKLDLGFSVAASTRLLTHFVASHRNIAMHFFQHRLEIRHMFLMGGAKP
ncbi:hypothetical protein DYB35_013784, partial [Aphanomyces astaci]